MKIVSIKKENSMSLQLNLEFKMKTFVKTIPANVMSNIIQLGQIDAPKLSLYFTIQINLSIDVVTSNGYD